MPPQKEVLAIAEVVEAFETAGIPCCLVGTCALRYYGARRMKDEWQLCVPTDQLDSATMLIVADPKYERVDTEVNIPNLVQTFPRYVLEKEKQAEMPDFALVLLPAKAAHLEGQCHPDNFERSQWGLPYPLLPVYVQSVLDVYDSVSLSDIIDGMNLTEEWGRQNLVLHGETDVEWAQWANYKMSGEDGALSSYSFSTKGISREKIWDRTVSGKQKRGGIKYPVERYATRFRTHGSPDPRTRDRPHV